LFTFVSVFFNYKRSAHLWASLFRGTSYVLILTKNGLGYFLGDFFTNLYGHPDQNQVGSLGAGSLKTVPGTLKL
jgi:hypothetical protein